MILSVNAYPHAFCEFVQIYIMAEINKNILRNDKNLLTNTKK